MDVSKLIVMVEKYPELYNMRHPEYFNNVRRDNIWEEISATMKQSSAECKDRWAKVRDNHRKALQRRRTKSGQAAKNIKPPKYEQELTFLVPYIIDEDNRKCNFTASQSQTEEENSETLYEDELQNCYGDEDVDNPEITESPSVSVNPSDDLQRSCASPSTSSRGSSIIRTSRHPQKRSRTGNSTEKTAANVLQEFLEKKRQTSEPAHKEDDALTSFFMTMTQTVKGFPSKDQIEIKKKIFQLVSDKELEIAMKTFEQPLTTDLNTVNIHQLQRTTTQELQVQPRTPQPARQQTDQFYKPPLTTDLNTVNIHNLQETTTQELQAQHCTLQNARQQTDKFSTGKFNEDPSTLKNYYTWGWKNSE